MSENRSVVIDRDYPHPPEKLWRALTEPHLIEAWLMKNNFAPAIGHRFQLNADWGGTLDCEVLVVEENRVLSYSWNFDHADPALRLRSTVTFTLTPSATGTRLRLEQIGFGPEQKRAYGGARAGWERLLARLEEVVEQSS